MEDSVALVIFSLIPVSTAALTRIGLRQLDPGETRVTFRNLLLISFMGMIPPVIALHLTVSPAQAIAMGLCCSLLLTSSHVDQVTSWAPDPVILPMIMAAGAFGTPIDVTGLPYLDGAVLGGVLFFLFQGIFVLMHRAGRAFITPPDMVVLAIPALFFGISLHLAAIYAVIAILLLLCLRSPRVRNAVSRADANAAGARDLGFDAEAAITLLPVVNPVLYMSTFLIVL